MLKPLLPEPRRVERRPGSFRLRAGQPLVLAAGADDGDFAAARALRDAVAARCGLRLAIEGLPYHEIATRLVSNID